MKKEEWPERGELVITKVKRITNYGAIVDLLEYPGKEGFVHISQISSSWVKNIRSVLSEGQMKVGKVKSVDPRKGTIDISFRDVSKNQEKRKNEEWKRQKKAEKLIERISKSLKEDYEEMLEKITEAFERKFYDVFSGFETASIKGEEALKGIKLPEKWKKEIVKVAKESITPQQVVVKGVMKIRVLAPDGIEVIKKALEKAVKEGAEIEYVSAPRYKIKCKAYDYKEAELILKKALQVIEKEITKAGGEFEFEREKN